MRCPACQYAGAVRLATVHGADVSPSQSLWARLMGPRLSEPILGRLRQCVRCGTQWSAMRDGTVVPFGGRAMRKDERPNPMPRNDIDSDMVDLDG